MKYKGRKIVTAVLICIFSIANCNIIFAHSGRTDSKGGHNDKNNVSGLGSYHYHCGGHPAHLHTNGVCPYSSSSSKTSTKSTKTTSKSGSSSDSSNSPTHSTSSTIYSTNKSKKTDTSIIEAESIKINETTKEMKAGDKKQLSVTISPQSITNKELTWESSDEDVLKVSKTGEVNAIGEGKAYITVSTSNKKTDSISIYVIKEKKENTLSLVKNQNSINKSSSIGSRNSNPLGTIITLSALSGGCLLGYKKYRYGKK